MVNVQDIVMYVSLFRNHGTFIAKWFKLLAINFLSLPAIGCVLSGGLFSFMSLSSLVIYLNLTLKPVNHHMSSTVTKTWNIDLKFDYFVEFYHADDQNWTDGCMQKWVWRIWRKNYSVYIVSVFTLEWCAHIWFIILLESVPEADNIK